MTAVVPVAVRKPLILVVDDDAALRTIIATNLELAGFRTVSA
jgi:CheY-like chemotaxis protein